MFLLLGGALCAIVSIVGILNFFNAILTGILARRREFAMLQAVGMTGKTAQKDADGRRIDLRRNDDPDIPCPDPCHGTPDRKDAGIHVLVF